MLLPQITEQQITDFIVAGLQEDIREGDHTSLACIPEDSRSHAVLKIKDYGVIAGVELAACGGALSADRCLPAARAARCARQSGRDRDRGPTRFRRGRGIFGAARSGAFAGHVARWSARGHRTGLFQRPDSG